MLVDYCIYRERERAVCRWIYLYILCIETIYIESGVLVDYCIYKEREQCEVDS